MTRTDIQRSIVAILEHEESEVSFTDLVQRVNTEGNLHVRGADVTAAVLPLLSSERVEFTPTRKFKIVTRKPRE